MALEFGREQVEKISDLDQGLRKIDEQLARDPSTDAEFTQTRLQELSQSVTADSSDISLIAHAVHEGYIPPEQNIRRSFLVDPVHIDDSEIYSELLKTLREFKASEWGRQPLRAWYLQGIQYTIGKYFGGFSGDEWENRQLYLERQSATSPTVSVAEFKGKGIAVCAEKAPTAQNLLVFAGANSRLIAAPDCRLPADGETEAHYYNIVSTDKGDFIFDPTNPSEIKDLSSKAVSYSPSLYKISKSEFATLLAGGEVSVMHRDFEQIEGQQQPTLKETRCIYGGPKPWRTG